MATAKSGGVQMLPGAAERQEYFEGLRDSKLVSDAGMRTEAAGDIERYLTVYNRDY